MIVLGDDDRKVQRADQISEHTQENGSPREKGVGSAGQMMARVVTDKAFNQEFLKNVFVPGESFRFYGRIEKKAGRYSMTSPAYEPCREGVELPSLIPVYPLTEGISQKQIAKDMRSAMILAASAEEIR